MQVKQQQKVVVAMSGGVDSSVAAALLQRADFSVIGVFMKFWSAPDDNGLVGRWNRCCSPEAEERARKVAQILKIPFYVLNFEKDFKKRIVDYFLAEYKAGRTPNPCVVCNKEIKFGLLLEKALGLGADFVATGHYARLRRETQKQPYGESRTPCCPTGSPMGSPGLRAVQLRAVQQNPKFKLLRARDKEKDQSYFLWQLDQKQLRHILFPIGDYTKKEVRALAKKWELPVYDVKESQEICFVRETVKDFLKKYLKEKPGPIVERLNKARYRVVGEHRGLWFYTIGQRKGIELGGGPAFAPTSVGASAGRPYYVAGKDLKKNRLIVSERENDLMRKELFAKKVNWISGSPVKLPLRVKAKIRYGYLHLAVSAVIERYKTNRGQSSAKLAEVRPLPILRVVFSRFQRAITPGQSVVFYRSQELLGGGIIC